MLIADGRRAACRKPTIPEAAGARRASPRRWSIAGRGEGAPTRERALLRLRRSRRCRSSSCARCRRSGSRGSSIASGRRPMPFFRRKLEAAGVQRADVRGLDDLRAHPDHASRTSCAQSEEAASAVRRLSRRAAVAQCVRLGASTGTSGRPTLILWTRKDLEVDYAASARGRWRWGLRPGMSLAQRASVRHERRRLALQPRHRGAGRAEHPVGPPVGDAHVARRRRGVAARCRPDMYRLFGNVGDARTPTRRARAASIRRAI